MLRAATVGVAAFVALVAVTCRAGATEDDYGGEAQLFAISRDGRRAVVIVEESENSRLELWTVGASKPAAVLSLNDEAPRPTLAEATQRLRGAGQLVEAPPVSCVGTGQRLVDIDLDRGALVGTVQAGASRLGAFRSPYRGNCSADQVRSEGYLETRWVGDTIVVTGHVPVECHNGPATGRAPVVILAPAPRTRLLEPKESWSIRLYERGLRPPPLSCNELTWFRAATAADPTWDAPAEAEILELAHSNRDEIVPALAALARRGYTSARRAQELLAYPQLEPLWAESPFRQAVAREPLFDEAVKVRCARVGAQVAAWRVFGGGPELASLIEGLADLNCLDARVVALLEQAVGPPGGDEAWAKGLATAVQHDANLSKWACTSIPVDPRRLLATRLALAEVCPATPFTARLKSAGEERHRLGATPPLAQTDFDFDMVNLCRKDAGLATLPHLLPARPDLPDERDLHCAAAYVARFACGTDKDELRVVAAGCEATCGHRVARLFR